MSEKNKESVQQKLARLNEQITWFQGPDFSLEEAIDKFQAAETLAADIEADLQQLKNNIAVMKQRFDKEV